jgi:hypothetical protein
VNWKKYQLILGCIYWKIPHPPAGGKYLSQCNLEGENMKNGREKEENVKEKEKRKKKKGDI